MRKRLPQYVQQRNCLYYFRYTLPPDIMRCLGKKELRYSLRTGYLHEAQRRARRLADITESLITAIRRKAMQELTEQQLQSLLAQYLREGLERDEAARVLGLGPKTFDELDNHIDALDELESDAREQLALKDYRPISKFVDGLLDVEGIELDRKSYLYKKMCREMLKVHIEIFKVDRDRSLGGYEDTPPPMVTPSVPIQASPDPIGSLSQVVSEYVKEHSEDGSWKGNTRTQRMGMLRMFLEIVGEDKPFEDIDRSTMLAFRDTLSKLPTNMDKSNRFKGKSIQEVLAMEDIKPIAVSTINKYLTALSALFEWAIKRGYGKLNVVKGLDLHTSRRKDEERDPFSREDLLKLFSSREYLTGRHRKNFHFWLPLLGMFTGARIGELCQLHVSDIREVDDVWCIDINADAEGKELKNAASQRIVPLHPELIKLGFLKHVAEMKKAKHVRVFPDLLPTKHGKYSEVGSKWFGDYRRKVGITERTKVFHSFRHTVATRLKMQDVEDTKIAELLGHTPATITMSRYAKRYDPKRMLEVVEKLDYGIDFSKLRVPGH